MVAATPKAQGILSNAGWNAFGTLFNIVISFLLTPLLIRRLGADQWGLLLLVWSVTGVLSLANFGMSEAALRYIAHYFAKNDIVGINRVLGASLTFYIAVCAVISAVVLGATSVVADWVKVPETSAYVIEPLLRLTTVLFTLGILTNAYRAIPMAVHRYDISNFVSVTQGVVRTAGLLILVLVGLRVLTLVVWEVTLASAVLVAHVVIARRLIPGLHWLPSISLSGIREIFGYSLFSFLTQAALLVYRELGKLLLGNQLGTASVAYLGTPDSVSNCLHQILINAIETLVPRFSAARDAEFDKLLLVASTWAAFVCVVAFYIPLSVLMPDLLRLWISDEFARESSTVGSLLTLGLIGSVTFAPIATLFRGRGQPAFVTVIMTATATVVLAVSLLLIPSQGVNGVGYAYLLSNVCWMAGLVIGWVRLYGWHSLGELARAAGFPSLLASVLWYAETAVIGRTDHIGWIEFFVLGATFSCVGAVIVVGVDLLLGGASLARIVLDRLQASRLIAGLRRRVGFGGVP